VIVVGGVGQLWQGDLDLGRVAAERLEGALGPGVVVEDLYYGAVAVAQRLEDLRPDALVLVGARSRRRPPGTVEVRRIAPGRPAAQAQAAVAQAVTGYVDTDLLLDVAAGLGALPADTVVVEVEPATTGPGEHLSPAGAAGLERALGAVRAEVARRRG
jgi:hydrogenase maturation protease